MLKTPLNEEHIRVGARMIDFFGFHMPVMYSTIIDEVACVRERVGLFDLTHMGRIEVAGPEREDVVKAAVTKNVKAVPKWAARYGLLLAEDGGIKDDVLIYREDEMVHVVVNCANRAGDLAHFKEHAEGRDVEIRHVSDEQAMIALQGPKSEATLQPLTDLDLSELGYYRFTRGRVGGFDAVVSRTGYTGEDGFELFVAPEAGVPIWQGLHEHGAEHGVQPIGLGARDVLRLEAAMPLYGQELSLETNPIEADVEFGLSMKSEFTGKAALLKVREAGLTRKRIGFTVDGKRIPRTGAQIVSGDAVIGQVTSGTFSPTLGKTIGMGYVPIEMATVGTSIEVDMKGKRLPITVVEMPFYKRER
ncbi:MAG: glycine cleavage system aminomethyltransferase GcvT [Planctomycetota bacterium]